MLVAFTLTSRRPMEGDAPEHIPARPRVRVALRHHSVDHQAVDQLFLPLGEQRPVALVGHSLWMHSDTAVVHGLHLAA
jgi:hypothetical protein